MAAPSGAALVLIFASARKQTSLKLVETWGKSLIYPSYDTLSVRREALAWAMR
jgi:hypothetical protein